jgi:hypothetical protein
LKAFCLAFALLLGTVPATAQELPQVSNASELAQPGSYQWTAVDDNGAPLHTVTGGRAAEAVAGRKKDAPARAALAQMRAETRRIAADAKSRGAKVQRIRYDLRLSCVVEAIEPEQEPLTNASMPWIWGATDASESSDEESMVEMCEVDYTQKVRSQVEPESPMKDYKVSLPLQ